MIKQTIRDTLKTSLLALRENGLYKHERILGSPQGAEVTLSSGKTVINFCANNYLGLASHPRVLQAAHDALDRWGYGLASVRFICGTQEIHKTLENKISAFLGTEDTILYAACFDANGGVFEPLLDDESSIVTDALNHASIIDGIRLTRARRFIYEHNDMADLESKLKEASSSKRCLIATDGAFSMDGTIACLDQICDLADKYHALVMVDDCHATGFIGKNGRGTHEYHQVMNRVDIITTTFGKALGGAMGGCTSGRKEIIETLRQKSRPYLFSNTLAPFIVGASIAVIDLLSEGSELRDLLEKNTLLFRREISRLGFEIKPGIHPIVPVMLHDEILAQKMAEEMLNEGIYVIGFSYPVVPKGQARIRVQLSALHDEKHLERSFDAFERAGKKLGII